MFVNNFYLKYFFIANFMNPNVFQKIFSFFLLNNQRISKKV